MKTLVFIFTILTTIALMLSINYQLPDNAVPLHYDVYITPFFRRGTFNGTVNITLTFLSDQYIDFGINSKNLYITEMDMVSSSSNDHLIERYDYDLQTGIVQIILKLTPSTKLQYKLLINFTGIISNEHSGLYRRKYEDKDKQIKMIFATNLRHGYARRLFPCFDELRFAATFQMHISRPEDYTSFSNTPRLNWPNNQYDTKKRYLDVFEETPRISPSSLGFVLGVFDPKSNITFKNVIIHVRPGLENRTEFSLDMFNRFLGYYGNLFCTYDMMGIELLRVFGIPHLESVGYSRAWGLITMDENVLTYSNDDGSLWDKQETIKTISYEAVFQWLGNGISLEHENAYWLSEGLAKYYQYFETHKYFPEYELDNQFVLEVVQVALLYDDGRQSRPLIQKTLNNSKPLLYTRPHVVIPTKGASILRMLFHCMNESNFETAIDDIIPFKFRTTTLPVKFIDFFNEWTRQAGYPVVFVAAGDHDMSVVMTQQRYLIDYTRTNLTYKYTIPISYATNVEPYFNNTAPRLYFQSGHRASIIWLEYPTQWIMLNVQQTGFYRVLYSADLYRRLSEALSKYKWSGIHVLNRAQYVDDLMSFGFNNYMSFEQVFEYLEYLQTETEYAPWMSAIAGFKRLMTYFTLENHKNFAIYIKFITEKIYTKLDIFEASVLEPYTTTRLRNEIVYLNCRYGREDCTEKALRIYYQYLFSKNTIPADMRATIICAAMRNANERDYDTILTRYHLETSKKERWRIRYGIGCMKNRKLVEKYYNFILSNMVPIEEKANALKPLYTENPENIEFVFWLISKDPYALVKACQCKEIATKIIKNIGECFTTMKQLIEYKKFALLNNGTSSEVRLTLQFLDALNSSMLASRYYTYSMDKYLYSIINTHINHLLTNT